MSEQLVTTVIREVRVNVYRVGRDGTFMWQATRSGETGGKRFSTLAEAIKDIEKRF